MSVVYTVIGLVGLIGQVAGFPSLYDKAGKCEGPTTALGKHGAQGSAPLKSTDITFEVMAAGEVTAEVVAGEEHEIKMPSYTGTPANVWLHATDGTFSAPEPAVAVASACETAAYTTAPSPEATFIWTPGTSSDCVTFTATASDGKESPYSVNNLELCPPGASPSATSPEGAGGASSEEGEEETEESAEGASGASGLIGASAAAAAALVAAAIL